MSAFNGGVVLQILCSAISETPWLEFLIGLTLHFGSCVFHLWRSGPGSPRLLLSRCVCVVRPSLCAPVFFFPS